MEQRSQLHPYIRPLIEEDVCSSGPDGSRALAPYLLVVVTSVRRLDYQVTKEPV